MSIKALTVRQVKALDQWAIETIGIPAAALMENAGRGAALHISKFIRNRRQASVLIICGTGNNGGDGFVAARHLSVMGYKPRVILVGSPLELKGEALANYRAARNLRIPVKPAAVREGALRHQLSGADVVVDAIFGVGLNRPLTQPHRDIIQAINDSSAKVVAVDIPSGLDGTTGKTYGICVKAHLTVTFSAPKRGFFKNAGPSQTGRFAVVDIGIGTL